MKKHFTLIRKGGFFLLGVFLLIDIPNVAEAQADRLDWLQSLSTVNVQSLSREDILFALDTIDLNSLTPQETDRLDNALGALERRWAAVHGENRVPRGYPAMTVFAGGMYCSECAELISGEILRIPGVTNIMDIDMEAQTIAFYYREEQAESVQSQAVTWLKDRLKNKGYHILSMAEVYLPANIDLADSLKRERSAGRAACMHE